MPRTVLSLSTALMGLALILVPAIAYAGLAVLEPLVIEPAPQRAGDVYRFRGESSEGESSTSIHAYVGERTVRDAWGRDVSADVVRVDEYLEDELTSAAECATVPGSESGIRSDLLAGNWGSGGATRDAYRAVVAGVPVTRSAGEIVTEDRFTTIFADNMCIGAAIPARSLVEGELVPLSQVFRDAVDLRQEVLSRPAIATTWADREALRVEFDLREVLAALGDELEDDRAFAGTVHFVFAQALPLAAEFGMQARLEADGEVKEEHFRVALDGYTAGAGPERGAAMDETASPEIDLTAYEPLRFDDEGLALPFPYAEAFAALSSDPQAGFASWIGSHPDGFLATAQFDRTTRHPFYDAQGDGGWCLVFRDGTSFFEATVARANAPGGLSALPIADRALTYASGWTSEREEAGKSPVLPSEIVTTSSIAPRIRAEGLDLEELMFVSYGIWKDRDGSAYAQVAVSDVPPDVEGTVRGTKVYFDPIEGRLEYVAASATTGPSGGGPLPLSADELPRVRGDVSAFSALVGPLPGSGVAAAGAAATGLALLVLALKLGLVPFYSRLVRDRLLDHPVRAQLFTRVRAEPGIRRQELIDFASVGEGATRRHLAALVKHGFVVEMHEGSGVAYYAAGDVPPALARKAAVLRSPTTRRVFELYAADPTVSLREAAARLGVSAPGVHRHKRKLEKAGLLPVAVEVNVEFAQA